MILGKTNYLFLTITLGYFPSVTPAQLLPVRAPALDCLAVRRYPEIRRRRNLGLKRRYPMAGHLGRSYLLLVLLFLGLGE